jgi:protein required for attachment to host cells
MDTLRARLVRRRPEDGAYVTIETLSPSSIDRPGRLDRDQPPARTHESVGAARHAIELRLSVRARAQAAFAKEVFAHLKARLHEGAFETFVLVAPTRMMGLLLEQIDPELEAALIAKLSKNLTKVPDHKLRDHLKTVSVMPNPRFSNMKPVM